MLQRVAFLNSWINDRAQGSGTAVAISHFRSGLTRLGVEVKELMSGSVSTESVSRRILCNLRLSRTAELTKFDSVVGFDMDGVFAPTRSVPYFVSLKGVARDEARFERGPARLKLFLLSLLERRNAAKADRVIVTSKYCKEEVRRRYGVPAEKISIIPESIDLDARRRLAEGVVTQDRERRPTILSVARQYRRKDTATLLRGIEQLVRRRKDVSLRIVGGGPELPRLQRLAARLELDENVAFLGPVKSQRELMREYREADIFCLSSRQEGFGIVFLEAMEAGLPIVAARAGAVPEVVPEDEAGLLFDPGDYGELAKCLEYLIETPELRREMGERGKSLVREYDLVCVAALFAQTISPLRRYAVGLEGNRSGSTIFDSKVSY